MPNKKNVADELLGECLTLARTKLMGADANRKIHETLLVACAEATRSLSTGFGNIFSQVDYLCKHCGIPKEERKDIQTMRRHSNKSAPIPLEEWIYDVRSLAIFISSVLAIDIPSPLLSLIPHTPRADKKKHNIDRQYVRCIVSGVDDRFIYAYADGDETTSDIRIDYHDKSLGYDLEYLKDIVSQGSQLNLLDCSVSDDVIAPKIAVVEPDFLLDISSIANCFNDNGYTPETYIANRFKPKANTQPILLGNLAGDALDDIISNDGFSVNDTIMRSFKNQALQYCTCPHFDPKTFTEDAKRQVVNLQEVVGLLFGDNRGIAASQSYNRKKVILEPSFVCERLGLQGRADLMTTDFKLLIEQKSGRNFNIEGNHSFAHSGYLIPKHYVQLLLYFGVLRYNYGITANTTDTFLLYSRYPAKCGLQSVNDYRTLFAEAIKLRNLIVADEMKIVREGFEAVAPRLNLQLCLSPLERAYFNTMATFVYREQAYSKTGSPDGHSSSVADLWNMPLHEKRETGNIYTNLSISECKSSIKGGAIDTIVLNVPPQGDDFLPNFRRGDMVYLYPYDGEPDIRRSLLHKGTLTEMSASRIVVRLNDGQRNEHLFIHDTYAVEHGNSDIATTSCLRGLYELATAPTSRKELLLGLRQPKVDTSLRLSRSYSPNYDNIILAEKQSRDYYLLVGPPGTGKTSMALRFMVEEELSSTPGSILLMSYTNRAIDEICAMLEDAGIDYMRMGNESSCEPRFAPHLIDNILGDKPKLHDVKMRIQQCRVIVGTTSTIQAKPFIFNLKTFSLAIVDEASQILEPSIVGLLATHRDGEARIGRFVLVGDYKQLPAVVRQSERQTKIEDKTLIAQGIADCRHSLFERLIRWEKTNNRHHTIGILRKQGRMHPEIARFPNEMFYREERLEPVPCPHQLEEALGYTLASEDRLDDILKMRRMVFIPSEDCREANSSENVNVSEANIVADVVRRIYRFTSNAFDPLRTIGIIVPYRNQIAMIRQRLDELGIAALGKITIDTVERYQGSQRDVIVYSFTVQTIHQLTFLTANTFIENGSPIDRKLNVAITRARKQMIMTGNVNTLSHNPIFQSLIMSYKV